MGSEKLFYFCQLCIQYLRFSNCRITYGKAAIQSVLEEKAVLNNSQGNTCIEISLYKVADLKGCNFIKKDRCFPMDIAKRLRAPFLKTI